MGTAVIDTLEYPGQSIGLTVVLDANLEDYATLTARSNGFKVININHYFLVLTEISFNYLQVLVQNGKEFPDFGERGILIGPGFESNIGVSVESSDPAPEMLLLPILERDCYTGMENTLEHYPSYTTSRCLKECITKKILEQCSCRPLLYPCKGIDSVCNLTSYVCVHDTLGNMH